MKVFSLSFYCFVILFCFYCISINDDFVSGRKIKGCSRPPKEKTPLEYIINPVASEWVEESELPSQFDWRNIDGQVYVTKIGNQLQPKFCGACWAFATTSSISDRIKILRNASTVDINLSPQALLDCGIEKGAGSCDGGSAINAFQFMQAYGITDDSCAPYMAVDYAFMSEYPCEETMCRTCDRLGNCHAIANATKYYVSEYGSVKGETNMMKEIWARGYVFENRNSRVYTIIGSFSLGQ